MENPTRNVRLGRTPQLNPSMKIVDTGIPKSVLGVAIHSSQVLAAIGGSGFYCGHLHAADGNLQTFAKTRFIWGLAASRRCDQFYLTSNPTGFWIAKFQEPTHSRLPGSDVVHHVVSFDQTADGSKFVVTRGGAGNNRLECWNVAKNGKMTGLWSRKGDEPIHHDEPYFFDRAHNRMIHEVRISHDSSTLVGVENTGYRGDLAIIVRNMNSGDLVTRIPHRSIDFQSRMEFLPASHRLLVWYQGTIHLWNLSKGRIEQTIRYPGRANITALRLHPSERFFITVGGDRCVRYWDSTRFTILKTLNWQVGKLYALDISADGTTAAAGGENGQVAVWDIEE
jgi:WD domain, G-beta repeat